MRRRWNEIGRGASELARRSDEGEKAGGNLEGTEGCWWGGVGRRDKWKAGTRVLRVNHLCQD